MLPHRPHELGPRLGLGRVRALRPNALAIPALTLGANP